MVEQRLILDLVTIALVVYEELVGSDCILHCSSIASEICCSLQVHTTFPRLILHLHDDDLSVRKACRVYIYIYRFYFVVLIYSIPASKN